MNTPVSVLIVEDEPIWAKQLEINLTQLGYTIAATYTQAAEVLVNIEKISFDIALLDIRMSGINAGIGIGKMIGSQLQKPFIYITSGNDKDTIDEAIVSKPSAFLIKPVNETSLYVAIQTALDNYSKSITANSLQAATNSDSFFVKHGNGYSRVDWKNVVALQVEGRYTKLITSQPNEQYLIGSTLSKTLSVIVPKHLQSLFIQINRTEAINSAYITTLKGNELICEGQRYVVSENYLLGLKKALPIV